jgi:DNA-binding MarR family transcriptional regulator
VVPESQDEAGPTPGTGTLEAVATTGAGRTAAWLSKQVELGLATVGLSLPQYRVMWLLDAGPRVPSDIADRLDVRPPSVTAVVDGLVHRGLVERRPAPDDRRCVTHVLTDTGRHDLAAADRAVERRLQEIAACLPTERQAGRAFDGLELWQRALLAHRERDMERPR